MDIKVGWIDRILSERGAKKDHYALILEVKVLRIRIEELQQEKGRVERLLGQLDLEMVYRDFTTHTIVNYKIQVVKRVE